MKTILYQDIAGGGLMQYSRPDLTRHDRIRKALDDIKHMGNIIIYLQSGRKIRKLLIKRY
jgi:hypothetical protein